MLGILSARYHISSMCPERYRGHVVNNKRELTIHMVHSLARRPIVIVMLSLWSLSEYDLHGAWLPCVDHPTQWTYSYRGIMAVSKPIITK